MIHESDQEIIARQRDAIQEMTLTIQSLRFIIRQNQDERHEYSLSLASLRAENERLTRAIRELEREDVSAVEGRVYDWNANVRADGEYLE